MSAIFILLLGILPAWGQLYDIDYQPVDIDEGPSCSEGLDFREITELLVGATCRVKDHKNIIPGHLLEDRFCVWGSGTKLGEKPLVGPDGSWSDMEILVKNNNKECKPGVTIGVGKIPPNALILGKTMSGNMYQAVLDEDNRTFKGFVSGGDPNSINMIKDDKPANRRMENKPVKYLSCE